MPVHERLRLAAICLRQLRRTCDALTSEGVDATAILIADGLNLARLRRRIGARLLGFGSYDRDNRFLSRKYNDGIQCALDPEVAEHPADFVVPCGSDDWVDHRLFLDLPDERTVVGFQRMSFVREDGREMTTALLDYPGGSGIRIYPRALLAPLGFRPADEDRDRGCDTSILTNLVLHHGDRLRIDHRHLHERQIVDWKSSDFQLNPYEAVTLARRSIGSADPFSGLARYYPREAVDEMRAHYAGSLRRAA